MGIHRCTSLVILAVLMTVSGSLAYGDSDDDDRYEYDDDYDDDRYYDDDEYDDDRYEYDGDYDDRYYDDDEYDDDRYEYDDDYDDDRYYDDDYDDDRYEYDDDQKYDMRPAHNTSKKSATSVHQLNLYDLSRSNLTQTVKSLTDINTISFDEPAFLPSAPIPDLGDFYYYYGPNPNSPYEYTSAQWLQDMRFLEDEVAWLNANFRLPYDVRIEAVECGEANAYYYPYYKKVQICYEYVDHIEDLWYMWPLLYDYESDAASLDDFVFANLYSTLYHEVGHAILDLYDLPFTGLEENVADQFGALILIRTEGGQDMLYSVADYYWYSSELSDQPHPYWDTHGSDLQRFSNISCYAYGADPVYNQDLIPVWLPEDRAIWCEEEYDQIKKAFAHLLYHYTNGFFDLPYAP